MASMMPFGMLTLLTLLAWASTIDFGRDATPFTFEEWIWATKGGYLPTMVSHYIRVGGL